jgi:hypothetical protein
MEQDTVVNEAPATEAPAAVVGLTLQDLRVLAGSIELGAQRGAYRAPEMEVIGATYNKLAKFLEANAPKEEAPVSTEDAPTGVEVTETATSAE